MRGSPKGARNSGGLDLEAEEMRGSPKGARNSGGLDLEAEERQEKVQNASRCTRAEDQTSYLCKKLYKIS